MSFRYVFTWECKRGEEKMNLIKAKDYEDMSRKAANLIMAQVTLKPDSVLGLATGSTPMGTYQQLSGF